MASAALWNSIRKIPLSDILLYLFGMNNCQHEFPKCCTRFAIAGIVFAICITTFGQDPENKTQDGDKKQVEFKFKGASVDQVIQYASKITSYIFVNEAKISGTVDAYSETALNAEDVLDFLISAFKSKGVTFIKVGNNIVKIVTIDEAKRRNLDISIGRDPNAIKPTEKIITHIIPLKNLTVQNVEKDLNKLFSKSAEWSKDSDNNALVVTDSAENIHRLLVVLSMLDNPIYDSLKLRIITLKNADGTEVAKMLNDIFKKEQTNPWGGGGGRGGGDGGRGGPGQWMQMFFGGGGGGDSGAAPSRRASDIIRIMGDARTNSIIVLAVEENINKIEEIVKQLDEISLGYSVLKTFKLKYAMAKDVADILNQMFTTQSSQSQQQQGGGRGGRFPFMFPGMPQEDTGGSSTQGGLRAYGDQKTNTLIVIGGENQIKMAENLISELDLDTSSLLKVRIYQLKSADATTVASIVSQTFVKDSSQSSNTGRQQGGGQFGNFFRMQGQQASTSVRETDIVRAVADLRTNSIVVTATEENQALVKEIISQLDSNETQALKVKIYPLRYADVSATANMLNSMMSSLSFSASSTQATGQQQIPGMGNRQGQQGQQGRTSGASKAIADTRTNSVIVTALDSELKIIDKIIAQVDRETQEYLKIKVYTLKNADPDDTSKIIKDLFKSAQTAPLGMGDKMGAPTVIKTVEVTTDKRTNSLVVKTSPEYLTVIDEMIKQLDDNPTDANSMMVIPLDNANAKTVADTLRALIKGGTVNTQNSSSLPISRQAQQQMQQSTTGTRSSGAGSLGGGSGSSGGTTQTPRINQYPPEGLPDEMIQDGGGPQVPQDEGTQTTKGVQGDVEIQADESTNTVIIKTHPRNFESIKSVVRGLDKFRPQVLIRVLIAEVTLDKTMQFGLEGSWENKLTVAKKDIGSQKAVSDFTQIPNTGALTGFSYVFTGDEANARLVALASDGKAKVLATPRILVLDNQMANINIGRRVPFVTNSRQTAEGSIINTVQYENVGIILKVTPHVSQDGLVTMIVHPEVSDLLRTQSGTETVPISEGVNAPVFVQNSADTSVAVKSGQTVILGGLIREVEEESESKVPLLGDLPGVGILFKSMSKTKQRRELVIFMTPIVVMKPEELDEMTSLEKAQLKLVSPEDLGTDEKYWRSKIRK